MHREIGFEQDKIRKLRADLTEIYPALRNREYDSISDMLLDCGGLVYSYTERVRFCIQSEICAQENSLLN